MCGIFGVIGTEEAPAEVYLGMLHLQHRGQDAAGMIVYDPKHKKTETGINISREKGLVSQVFTSEDLQTMKGNLGIGHTRYPTAGCGEASEIQPFFSHHPDGIGLGFNGNIVNYVQLKKQLEQKQRIYFSSRSDGEVLLYLFAEEYKKKKGVASIFNSVKKIQEKTYGGYSVVVFIANQGLLAFKDPNGIKPLLFGEKKLNGKKSYAFASESIALSIQGYSNIRDLKAGEAIFVDEKSRVYSKVLVQREAKPCIFEWVYFSTVESVLGGMPIYTARENLGKALAKKIKEKWPDLKVDLVIPVPDTSRPAAHTLANELGLAYGEGLVKNRYVGRTFIMPVQKVREESLRLKLKPIEPMIRGKRIMVVDDSIVRGTTSKRIVKLLRDSGAKAVYLLSTFPPIRHPCYYGIDFTSRGELVANDKTIKEIEKEIGADKLIYIDVPELKKAVGIKSTCDACVTGKYPTNIRAAKSLEKNRQKDMAKLEEES